MSHCNLRQHKDCQGDTIFIILFDTKPLPHRHSVRKNMMTVPNIEMKESINVVVQFYPCFKFYFPLFLGMVMYDNELKTKENKI